MTVLFIQVAIALHAQSKDRFITLQIVQRGFQSGLKVTDAQKQDAHDPSLGHIFMIVKLPTNHGEIEEAYGFYPVNGIGIIKGPGALKSEFRCANDDDCGKGHEKDWKRLSESEASASIPIDIDERHAILDDINLWNKKQYRVTSNNCMDFMNSVLKTLDYPAPERSRQQLPADYMSQLQGLVKTETDKRADAKAAAEAEAQRQAEIEANRKPDISGRWVDNRGTVFSVQQSGDNLTFNGPPPFGAGSGHFQSKTSFVMSWPKFGTRSGNIAATGTKITWNTGGVFWVR
jgi:hypothetical protein